MSDGHLPANHSNDTSSCSDRHLSVIAWPKITPVVTSLQNSSHFHFSPVRLGSVTERRERARNCNWSLIIPRLLWVFFCDCHGLSCRLTCLSFSSLSFTCRCDVSPLDRPQTGGYTPFGPVFTSSRISCPRRPGEVCLASACFGFRSLKPLMYCSYGWMAMGHIRWRVEEPSRMSTMFANTDVYNSHKIILGIFMSCYICSYSKHSFLFKAITHSATWRHVWCWRVRARPAEINCCHSFKVQTSEANATCCLKAL